MSARWLSVDPIWDDITDPQNLNRYSYVTNDPINFVDPDGLRKGQPPKLKPPGPRTPQPDPPGEVRRKKRPPSGDAYVWGPPNHGNKTFVPRGRLGPGAKHGGGGSRWVDPLNDPNNLDYNKWVDCFEKFKGSLPGAVPDDVIHLSWNSLLAVKAWRADISKNSGHYPDWLFIFITNLWGGEWDFKKDDPKLS